VRSINFENAFYADDGDWIESLLVASASPFDPEAALADLSRVELFHCEQVVDGSTEPTYRLTVVAHEPYPFLLGVVLPKVNGAEPVEALFERLGRLTNEPVGIVPLVETAAGVVAVDEIAAASGVDAVAFGDQDFTADIGATVTDDKTESLYARQRVVVAAAAAGVDAFDTVHTDIGDLDGLREQAEFAAEIGFDGKLAVHPDQIPEINGAFTPAADRLEWAETVLAERERAEEAGAGAFTVDGQMIDPPLIERAEEVIERAEAAGIR